MELKDKIVLYRSENHLTQSEFGELIGVKKRAVINYEKGSMPTKLVLVRIKKLLGE